jgi:hypothetical protein
MAYGYAANAKVTDVSGQTYQVKSLRLAKGFTLPFIKEAKIDIYCDGVRITHKLKSVKSLKINPAKIASIDGKLHFGVEILLKDSTALGNINERGGCYIAADNGFMGKSSKGKFSVPFDRIGTVYFLGKEDTDAAKAGKDGAKEGEEKAPEGGAAAAGTEGGEGKTPETASEEGGESKTPETAPEEGGGNKTPEAAGEGSNE